MARDDRSLLEQWSKRGDGEAFATLVARYGGMVYGACRRILGNPSDAEDIAQECFEALAVAGTKPGAYVGAWLHRVATYHAISRIRSDVRRRQRETLYSAERKSESTLEWKDIYAYVDEAIEELPEKLRRPLIAHFLEGQSKEGVGQTLGLSRQLASYRIERGLERVRAALQRKGVLLGAALLTSLMGANAAEAAPAALAARLGKIALTGPGVTASVAATAALKAASRSAKGAGAAKVIGGATAVAAVLALVFFWVWQESMRPYPTQDITAVSTFSAAPRVPVEKRRTPASSASGPIDENPGEGNPTIPSGPGAVETLEPGTIVYGVVLDENAQPIARATVTLDNHEENTMEELRARLEGRQLPTAAHELNLRQITNARGEFAFERVPVERGRDCGLILAACSGERYAMKTIGAFGEGRKRYHELVLSPGGIVRGQVIDWNNVGVPGAFVRISPIPMLGEQRWIPYVTKADGSFESRPLPQGIYELFVSASSQGYVAPERPCVRPDGTMNVIRLERRGPVGSISGWVVNAEDGRRMPGLGVTSGVLPEVATGANGEFVFEKVFEGTCTLGLSTRSEPYALAEPVSVELRAGQRVTGVELKATRGFSVSGQVLAEASRKPVGHASLTFARGKGYFDAQTFADENGRFTVAQLGPGDYAVRLWPPNSLWTEKTTALSVRGDMDNVQLLMESFRAARGTVLNGAGTPVAGASVVVIPVGSSTRASGIADAVGVFEIPLSERIDSFYVQAYGDGGVSKLTGPVGLTSHPQLRLEDAGAIEGTVVDATGQPVAGALVAAIPEKVRQITALNSDGSEWNPERGASGTRARTALSGAFELAPLLPGRLLLEVYLPSSAKGYPVAETVVTVSAGETLKARLVLDLSGYGAIEGVVTQGDLPMPFVTMGAYSQSGNWVAPVDAHTDENGCYIIANVRAGEVQVLAYVDGHNSNNQTVQLAENEVRRLDFNFEQGGAASRGISRSMESRVRPS